jgi:hypothetical protein
MKQITNSILMIRPVNFRMNEQTAVNNYYQKPVKNENATINLKAQAEFDAFVAQLKKIGVHVIVVQDSEDPDTPDALFPNNWISFHEDGAVVLYPMFAENRRLERREDIFELLENEGFQIETIVDYTAAEKEQLFLEGTGSMVLDRVNKKAYCSLSPRANEELLIEFCEDFEYTPVIFTAYQSVKDKRMPIYHTNVMMALAEDFAVICLECIDDKQERKNVIQHLKADGKEIIAITETQVHHFAGNMIQVLGKDNKWYLVMSEAAYQSLTKTQLEAIKKYSEIVYSPLATIESCGGGSARCMMAEIFLPRRR